MQLHMNLDQFQQNPGSHMNVNQYHVGLNVHTAGYFGQPGKHVEWLQGINTLYPVCVCIEAVLNLSGTKVVLYLNKCLTPEKSLHFLLIHH